MPGKLNVIIEECDEVVEMTVNDTSGAIAEITQQADLAEQYASEAEQSASTASGAASTAVEAASSANEDAIQTAADRAQTELDRVATGEDALATKADAAKTAEDREQTGMDRIATGEDRAQTVLDAQTTAADRVQTGQDRIQTGEDRTQTTQDALATAGDREQTGIDRQAAVDAAGAAVQAASNTHDDRVAVNQARVDVEGLNTQAQTAATTATEQAGIATDQAGEAEGFRNEAEGFRDDAQTAAASITPSVTPMPNTIPISGDGAKLDRGWLDLSSINLSQARIVEMHTLGGQSTFMYRLPAFNCEDVAPGGELGTGLYPAFLNKGVAEQAIYIGAYPAAWVNDEVVCQPGQDPNASISFDAARQRCKDLGPGWDIMSNWDWAAIALWCMANGFEPRGNTNHGRHHVNRWETGQRTTNKLPGESDGIGRTLTGSGPSSWAHDGTPGGIHDLVGNVWEWNSGLILRDGVFEVAPDNGDWAEAEYIDTGVITDAAGTFSTRTYVDPPVALRQALVVPTDGLAPIGYFYRNEVGERFPSRGGSWSYSGNAGLGALNLNGARSSAYTSLGFRPRFRNL